MTKTMKKFSALLLSLALVLSMLPFVTAQAFADEEASVDNIEVTVNGSEENPNVIGYLTREWLNENEMDELQVFPYATKKNNGVVKYRIFKGVDMNVVFDYLGLSTEQLEGATIFLCQGSQYDEKSGAKNPLKIDHLENATKVMKGKWDSDAGVDARKFIKLSSKRYAEVTPVLVTGACSTQYNDYWEALDALDSISLDTGNSLAVGNSGDPYKGLDAQGFIAEADNGAIDCCARYGINDFIRINIVTPDAESMTLDKASLTFNNLKPQTIAASLSPKSAELATIVNWTSTNTKVAKVDKNGTVTPVGIGKCEIKATADSFEEKVSVTVNKNAFKPAKVTGLKASSPKKGVAKVSWKKVGTASGYTVYYKVAGTKKWKTKTTTRTSITIKKLAKGKKCAFKVAAYRKVSGQTVAGATSVARTIKIKK